MDVIVDNLRHRIQELVSGDVVLVGGSIQMTKCVFKKYYEPLMAVAIESNVTVRVGCASGCDEFTQNFCKGANYKNVEVWVSSKDKNPVIQSEDFKVVRVDHGGYKERDRLMCRGCKQSIILLSQYAGGGSGSAANLINVARENREGNFIGEDHDGYDIVELIRSRSFPYDEWMQKEVLWAELRDNDKCIE